MMLKQYFRKYVNEKKTFKFKTNNIVKKWERGKPNKIKKKKKIINKTKRKR